MVKAQGLGAGHGNGQQLDLVSGLACPLVGRVLAGVIVLPDGTTCNGEGGLGLGEAGTGGKKSAGQQRVGEASGHGHSHG